MKLGADLFAIEDAREELRKAGFIDVERRDIPIIGKGKVAGLRALQLRLEAWSTKACIDNAGWTPKDAASFLQGVIDDLNGHMASALDGIYSQETDLRLSIVCGKKP